MSEAAAAGVRITDLRARAVEVPMARPLATAGGAVTTAPLVLVDSATSDGATGHAYVFCYTPLALGAVARLLDALGEPLRGQPAEPLALAAIMARTFRLLGPQGITGIAAAGIDMAAWDARARAAGLPLCRLLGGAPVDLPAYNSNGLGMVGPQAAATQARELIEPGFRAVKVRLGYADAAADRAVVRAVREAVGPDVTLMSDYNQSLVVAEAEHRAAFLDGEGLAWIEEPVRADDYAGAARVRAASRTPTQLGENCWGPHDVARALAAGACDLIMPDAVKIGGVTGWLGAAALAEAAGMPVSSHTLPEVSAHLLAVTPTRHWLEYVDWANPVLCEPLPVADGAVRAPERPGTGIEWDEPAVARYLVR